MNQKELNEIRRRFKLDKNAISRIYGCYVNSNKEIIANIDASMGLMSQEEQEMYLGLLKKSLSGALGRNLIDIEFSTAQVTDSDEHRLLQTVRQTALQDRNSREALCRRIIDAMDMGETNYLILLAADTYDVPYRGRDDETFADGSDTVYKYFVCSICPVKAPTLELKYSNEDSEFHSASTGHIALAPELGFLFPAFDDRAEVGDMLSGSGVSAEKVEAFQEECRRQYGEDAALNPKNIIESGKFQITTPEVKIAVSPEYSYMIEARVIDGRRYILIPADDGVEINGIGVNIPNPQKSGE